MRGSHRWLVNSPHKGPETRKMLQFENVIMLCYGLVPEDFPSTSVGLLQYRILPKRILNSNLAKSRLPINYCSVVKLFWNFAQSTAVSLQCSLQFFKTTWQPTWVLWTNEISRDLSLRFVSGGYPIWQSPKDYFIGTEAIMWLARCQVSN